MRLHSLQVDVTAHFIVVSLQVQTNLLSVLPELRFLQMFLVIEQQIVEQPEASLGTGCFGREFGMRVDLDLRIMSKHESHPMTKMLEYDLHRRVRLATRRTFKVAIFDDAHLCERRASDVVGCLVRRQQRISKHSRNHIRYVSALDR